MNGDEGEEDWSSRTQWWQKSLCVWGLWLSTVDSKRFDLKLTMAHNQDRLQNSDSSVVYGHGHIIYSHTARTGRQQAVQAGDAQARRLAAAFSEAIASHSLTWATHHYDKPSNSQLWVWMALLKNTSQSISPSPLAARKECALLHWLFFEQAEYSSICLRTLNLMLLPLHLAKKTTV